MSQRAIKSASGYFELFLKDGKFRRGIDASIKKLRNAGRAVSRLGAGFFGFGAGIVAGSLPAIKAASDLQETMNKFNVVFGARSAEVKKYGDDFAGMVGRSKEQVASFLAGAQDLFVPIGFDAASAEKMSKDVTGLAIDLASFNNQVDADVMRDLQSALTGSGAVMKKYGVILTAAAVNQEIFQQGIDPSKATEQEKVMARMNIIMRGTTAAQGDAIRSAGSWANQLKAGRAAVTDLAATIGGPLLAVFTPMLTTGVAIVRSLAKWGEQNTELIGTIARMAIGVAIGGAALVALGGAITAVGFVAGGLASIMSLVAGAFAFVVSPIGIVLALVAGAGVAFLKFSGTGGAVVEYLKAKFGELKGYLSESIGAIGKALAAGDISLAAKVLWASLNAAWASGVAALNQYWQDWKAFFREVFNQAVFGVLELWVSVVAKIQSTWVSASATFASGWASFKNSAVSAWTGAQDYIATGILKLQGLLDDTFDVDGAIGQLKSEAEKQQTERDRQTNEQLRAIDQAERDQLAKVADFKANQLAGIDGAKNEQSQAIIDDQKAAADAAAEGKDAAVAAYREAVEEAKKLPKVTGKGIAALSGVLDGSGIAKAISNASAGAAKATKTAAGTFDGFAAARVLDDGGAVNVAEQQLTAQKAIVEEVKKNTKAVEAGGVAFG